MLNARIARTITSNVTSGLAHVHARIRNFPTAVMNIKCTDSTVVHNYKLATTAEEELLISTGFTIIPSLIMLY